jgi:hypothetical protein
LNLTYDQKLKNKGHLSLMMEDLKSNLTIFWSENSDFLAIYLGFAFVVCFIIAGLEYRKKIPDISLRQLIIKASVLIFATTVFFALCSFILGWYPNTFGGEIMSTIAITVMWFFMLYKLNVFLICWSKQNPYSTTSAFIPVLILIAPFVLFTTFILILGSMWTI